MVQRDRRADKYPVGSQRSPQRGKVGHRVGTGTGRDTKPAVQELVPDPCGRQVVAETHDLHVIDVTQARIDRQSIGQGRRRVGGIGVLIERMDVPEERALLMSLFGDEAVVGKETGRWSSGISGVARQNQVFGQAEEPGVAPYAGVVLLVVRDQQVAVVRLDRAAR